MSENSFESIESAGVNGVEITPPMPARAMGHPPDNGVEKGAGTPDVPDPISRVVVVCNRKPPPPLRDLGARHGADHVRLRAWALDFEGYLLESRNQELKAATSGLFSSEVVEQIKAYFMESMAADGESVSYADATAWWRNTSGSDVLALLDEYFNSNEKGATSEGQRIQDIKSILSSLPSTRSVLPAAVDYHQRHLFMDAHKVLVQLPSMVEQKYPGGWKMGLMVSDELVRAFLDKFPSHFRAVVQRRVIEDLQHKKVVGNKADMFLYHAQAQSFMWKLNSFFSKVDDELFAPLSALIDGLGTELVGSRSGGQRKAPGGASSPSPKKAEAPQSAGIARVVQADGLGCFRCGRRECSRGSDMRTACLLRADSSFTAEETALGRAHKKAFYAKGRVPRKP